MTVRLDISQLAVYLLLLCRVAGVFALAPLVGSERIPARIKAALALMVSLVLFASARPGPTYQGPLGLALAACGEVVIGLTIGFGARLIFAAVQMAGELADAQSAFGFAGIVAPDSGERTSVIGQLHTCLAWLIFLGADGHHIIFHGLAASFTPLPLGAGPGLCAPALTQAVAGLLAAAVRMAAPVVGAVLLADFALGLLTRAAPQMNLLAIGFPVKLLVGLVAALLALPLLAGAERGLLWMMEGIIRSLLLGAK